MPPGESEEQSPGIAARIFPVGSDTPITPVEETRREPSRRPSAPHAPAEILRTASLPSLPVHALAFPLLATTPRRADRDRRPLPHSTRPAGTRRVAAALPGGVALGAPPRPGDFAAGEVPPPGGRGRLPDELLGLL